jgi:hypothetical protein
MIIKTKSAEFNKALQDTETAIEQAKEMDRLNEPTRALNVEIRENNIMKRATNKQIRDYNEGKDPEDQLPEWQMEMLMKRPHVLPPPLLKIIEAEKEHARAMKQVEPRCWRETLDEIADPHLRVQTACIVWWDHFGNRTSAERWPELDDYIGKSYRPCTDEQLVLSLYKCGYTAYRAARRVVIEAKQTEEDES